jgi:hypothetical protein
MIKNQIRKEHSRQRAWKALKLSDWSKFELFKEQKKVRMITIH